MRLSVNKYLRRDIFTRTDYCDQCLEITVSSSGGTLEHQPHRLGTFTVAGSIWGDLFPLWKADNDQVISPDAAAFNGADVVMWGISDFVGGGLGFTGNNGIYHVII